MRTMRWLGGLAAILLVAGTVRGAPGDGPGEGPGDGTGQQFMMGGPEIPEDLQAELDAVREAREALLSELKALLEENADATEEERAALVEQWREDNAEALEALRDAMQSVRQDIREWRTAERPVRSKKAKQAGEDNGQLGSEDTEALMVQLKEQRQARKQTMEQIREKLDVVTGDAKREQIMAQFREQRLEEMEQARKEVRTRSEQSSRDESVTALRERLQEQAQTLRSQSRLRDREEATQRIADERGDTVRDTLRDQIRDQDRDRLSE